MKTLSTLTAALAFAAIASDTASSQVTGEAMYRTYGRPFAELEKARCIGDINGDGAVEFIVGSPRAPKSGSVGYCAIISGMDGLVLREHFGLTDTSWFGQDFTSLHDLDGDGVKEYAVSAPGYMLGPDQGCVFIYDGATGAQLRELRDIATSSRMGDWILGDSDFTGDGVPDLAVVAGKQTSVKIYSGTELLTSLHPASKIDLRPTPMSGKLGTTYGNPSPMSAISDLDGDGADEIGLVNQSRCLIFSGATGLEIFSHRNFHESAIISIGDLNADGVEEFVIGSGTYGGYDSTQGRLECFDGATKAPLWDYHVAFDDWFVDGTGACLVLVDDVDGDGYRDFVTGKGGAGNSGFGSGVEMFSSKTGTPIGRHWGSPFSTYSLFPEFGSDIAAGDIDGDGKMELLIGEPRIHHKYGGFIDKRAGVVLAVDLIF